MVIRPNQKCLDTHIKRWSLKYSIIFFINLFFIIKKIFLYVCVTKHFLFGHVTNNHIRISRIFLLCTGLHPGPQTHAQNKIIKWCLK